MITTQKSHEILFAAGWKRAFNRQNWLPLWCGISPVMLQVMSQVGRGWTSWSVANGVAALIVGFWVVFYASLLRPQRIMLLSDRLRFISCYLKQDVLYQNMRVIALAESNTKQFHLSFKLHNPRYKAQSVVIPPELCSAILQILAREAPQAEMNELAVRWRDNAIETGPRETVNRELVRT